MNATATPVTKPGTNSLPCLASAPNIHENTTARITRLFERQVRNQSLEGCRPGTSRRWPSQVNQRAPCSCDSKNSSM